jgi:hypothetical protein
MKLTKLLYNSTSIVMFSILIIYFIVYSNPIHAETQWSPEIYYIVKQRFYVDNFAIIDELLLLVSEQNLNNKSISSILTTMFNNTLKSRSN